MPRYSIDGTQNTTSSLITSLTAIRGASRRVRIYDFTIGSEAAPVDNAIVHTAQRFTAVGTAGAGVTPQSLDPADPASITTAGENHSIEPTYTANAILWTMAANQRATYRWVAAPDGELIIPDTANNGIGWRTIHSSFTGLVNVGVHFLE